MAASVVTCCSILSLHCLLQGPASSSITIQSPLVQDQRSVCVPEAQPEQNRARKEKTEVPIRTRDSGTCEDRYVLISLYVTKSQFLVLPIVILHLAHDLNTLVSVTLAFITRSTWYKLVRQPRVSPSCDCSALSSNQVNAGESPRPPTQRGDSPHGSSAPAGPGWHQPGDHRRGQHPAADHRGQLAEIMIWQMDSSYVLVDQALLYVAYRCCLILTWSVVSYSGFFNIIGS